MHKFKTKKYIIFFVIITIIFIIVGFIFYNNNKSIIKDKYMREITFYGYKSNEITPIMCSEMVGDLVIDNLNYLNTLEDLKLFKKLELIHIGDIWNAPEENVISEKKLDKFIKQLNETFVSLPSIRILSLENVPYITDFSFLNDTKIKDLTITYNENIDFDSVYSIPQLESLTFKQCDIDVDDLSGINKSTKLRRLLIEQEDFKYDSQILDVLYECDNLKKIYLCFKDDIPDDEKDYQHERFEEKGIMLYFW